jgi:PHP family Zn ribbon phosphoesterase
MALELLHYGSSQPEPIMPIIHPGTKATEADLLGLARMIRTAVNGTIESNRQAKEWIRVIHKFPNGSEALRLIVRDDLEGVGNAVADAIWEGLM